MSLNYDALGMAVRGDLAGAHARAWERLGKAGTWWRGVERLAIAAETRHAPACRLCQDRKAALSPYGVAGEHDDLGNLPEAVVEIVHRVATDQSRLTKAWYDGMLSQGVSDAQYVETIGVLATVLAVDGFCRALGMPPHALPSPQPGEPTRRRPRGAKTGLAWVPTLAPEDVDEDDPPLYRNRRAVNVQRALSLVPDEVVGFFEVDEAMYLPDLQINDFANEYRAISHAQIELLAARISAINQCVY